jgi:hypothetical protein
MRAVLCLVGVAVIASGCGGPMQREELGRGIETLRSVAADGSLLARGVAEDRTRSPFVRTHARDLAEDAGHEAEKLHDAKATRQLVDKKRKAVALAQRISNALESLQLAPGDEAGGRTAERQLSGLARQARDLSESL